MTAEQTPFGFTAAWYALGIVTPARLAALEQRWAGGEDPYPEHYRWQAFQAFVQERRPLAPELAAALYDLGASEADRGMGESIMHVIAALPECPVAVLERARASGRKHLCQAAARDANTDAT